MGKRNVVGTTRQKNRCRGRRPVSSARTHGRSASADLKSQEFESESCRAGERDGRHHSARTCALTSQWAQHFILRQDLFETAVSKKDDRLGHRFVEIYDLKFLLARFLLHFQQQPGGDAFVTVIAVDGKLRKPPDTRREDDIPDTFVAHESTVKAFHLQASLYGFDRVLPRRLSLPERGKRDVLVPVNLSDLNVIR